MSDRGTLKSILVPHAHAEALINARIHDGGSSPVWLEAHVEGGARCRAYQTAQRELHEAMLDMRGTKAPEGFAGRVMMAARMRGRAEPVESRPALLIPFSQLVTGGALVTLVAAGIAVLVAVGPHAMSRHADPKHGQEPLRSGGAALKAEEAPHFLVRAPGIGAAKARSQVTAIVSAHGGTYVDSNGALVAQIPRAALIAVTQDLASQGRYKMSNAVELEPSLQTITIRFELE